METVDYSQRAEDHQSFLVLVRHTGKQLSWKHFCRCWERISLLDCVAIPGQKRDMWIRYKKSYTRENNEWGDFQAHRKVLGLVSVGRCSSETDFEDLFVSYKKEKEQFSETLFNSRLIVLGMNSDGSSLTDDQQDVIKQKSLSPEPMSMKIDGVRTEDENDNNNCDIKAHVGAETPAEKNRNGETVKNEEKEHTDPLRKSSPIKFVKINKSDSKASKAKNKVAEKVEKAPVQKTLSNSKNKEMTGSEVVFYPSIDDSDGLEECMREFVTSLFFVLEGKRLDRSFERADRQTLLCAPMEKKDYVGIDPDSKSYKKKCQGRLRKHLADLCLQASLPGEAMLHYTTALDILRPVNDHLWMAACYEGLCSASVISNYTKLQPMSGGLALRRNQSFSVKRGVAGMDKQRTGSMNRTYANGLQDLPDMAVKSCLNPDDIVEKYREALLFYSKYKNAGVIELETNLKACRVLIDQQKYLQASEFLQNVVYINLQFTDEDRICRYITLSSLYGELGFLRKAAFFKRVAAMQCVGPQNPNPDWHACHQLLVQTLPGYRIHLDPKDGLLKGGHTNGWPVVQVRVLHEIIYSAKRMGNLPLAIRYTTLLLYKLLSHLSEQEVRDVVISLENLTSQCEGTVHPLALESGVILPPVHLYNIPLVRSFKLMPLHPHMEPKPLKKDTSASDNVFIFTPLNIGALPEKEGAVTDVDFCWVEGDMSEVQLQVNNPMPDELKVSNVSLMTDGVEVESFPSSPSVPPSSGPYLVKIMHRPTSHGDLKITGYTTSVFGVKSNCRLRDCPCIPQTYFQVKVVPALPTIQLTTSLRKSANFLSFGEEFNVVTSATATVYTGQSCECVVTIQNSSKLPVELVKVGLETTSDTKEYVKDLFQWSDDNIQSQLPVLPNNILCFTVALHGVSNFLPAPVLPSLPSSPVGDRHVGLEGKTVEAILKVEYSGGPGLGAEYCRCCSVAFTIEVMPSLVFQKWDVMPSESCEHCYLLFDVQNVCGAEIDVQYSSQRVHLQPQQIRRICVQVDRCSPPMDQSEVTFGQFLATFVDIRWSIPSQKLHGKASIEHLTWNPEQQELVCTSPVSWEVKLNGQILSPLYIGSLEYLVGQQIRLDVEVSFKSETEDVTGKTGVLSFCCCQHCDAGEVRYDVGRYVCPLGSQSVIISQLNPDRAITHSCTYMFLCCGFYRFEVTLKVKGQPSEITGSDKGQSEQQEQTYKCSSVIEVNIEE